MLCRQVVSERDRALAELKALIEQVEVRSVDNHAVAFTAMLNCVAVAQRGYKLAHRRDTATSRTVG